MERAIKKSRRGVYYDLSISPYVFETKCFKLVFSSEYRLNKFAQGLPSYIEKRIKETRINIPALNDTVYLLEWYSKIERKSLLFTASYTNKWYTDISQVKFNVYHEV